MLTALREKDKTMAQKAKAGDSTDAEVIKGKPTEPPTEAAPNNLTTAAALEAGEPVTGAGGPAQAGTETQGSLGSVSASPSPAGSATTGYTGNARAGEPESVVHSIVSTQVGSITRDADTAMHHLRGDVNNLHRLLSNATHYATLPVAEVEKLIARASALLGVIRSRM